MNEPPSMLEDISSRWALITDPLQFVMRYAPAIQAYLTALIRDPHQRDEVQQEFLLRVVQRGFAPQQVTRGRFRDYLKAAVRNAALTHLRRRPPRQADDALLADLAAPAEAPGPGDRRYLDEWRQTVLDQALERLAEHERQAPDGRAYAVLRATLDQPEADSPTLAAAVARASGRPMSAAAFRKQLTRARALFAGFLVEEIRQTLEAPTPDLIEEELGDLGLLEYVRPYLEADP